MSAVAIFFPIIAAWPVFAAAAASVAATAGYAMVRTTVTDGTGIQEDTGTSCEIPLENSENLAMLMETEGGLSLTRDNVRISFSRIPDSMRVKMCVEGEGKTSQELEEIGRSTYQQILQQYAYHRVVSEMKNQGFTMAEEEIDDQQNIRITVRRWS